MKKRIIIIGAGPIGCYTAQLLKTYGYDPLLIEEHNEIGKPIHCTGLVGNKVFEKKSGFKLSTSSILNTINGAVIHFENQHFILRRNDVAYVIDREKFDKELSSGLDILYQNRFLGLEKNNASYVIETDKDELFADIVIGADGANSVVRKAINQNSDLRYFRGLQLRLKTKVRHPDMVEVYLKKPSFFWIVPESKDIVRVGTISQNPHSLLKDFLDEVKLKGEVLTRFGGLVAIGICNNTTKDNIALVGDAACQMKPLTFGGIYFGLRAATMLAHCLRKNRLDQYDSLWKSELSSEISIGLKVKDYFDSLEAAEFRKIFNLMKREKSLIERVADFENHSKIVLEVLKRPSFYPLFGELFKMLFSKGL